MEVEDLGELPFPLHHLGVGHLADPEWLEDLGKDLGQQLAYIM